ncbi:hypothetical protein MPTK1_4g08730 [Marchantia polymorpha subsp. ruderalis]|uniref:Bacterial transcriptional activator domain-containing protein n=2 Tax=Marchantia polymorpha TaxID=3197 RepID=A0AAF6B7U8_MARPO|nr:hypothetical protein MARPO_0157s0006 [Marchantia polymorpha]BBN08082.1 hypothetical protein Mp_4g08730 [Marchantia polymorpha subsp. ruderalis]|eukprot:PTQ28674.1 hypothetical protein MARPO_0157s0006 [Marchantia polymorpha]
MANLGAVKAHCLRGSCDFFSPAKCSRVTHTRSRPRVEQLSGLFARHLNSGIFSQRRFNSSSGDRCKRLVSPRNGSMAQQGDSGFARDEPVHVSRIPEGEAVRQGSSPKKLEAEHWEVVQFQAVEKKSKNIVAFYLASGLLALGLCFSFCKPAMAKIVENQPTVTAKLNEKGEVEVQDRALETSGEEGDEVSAEKNGEKADDFEPVFGEGSDLTSDPTEILLRSYLERHPNDLKALQALLYMRLKKGEINAAHAVIDKLIELEPDQLEWKFIRAQAFEFVGELEQARQAFQEIIELRPLSARALQGLAVVMQKNGEDEQALELLGEAVKKAVDAGQAKEATNLRMLLGQMHTIQGNLDEAMELYRTVVEEDPQDYRPYLCQGLVYSIIGEEAEAEKQFRSYRKLCPKDFPHRGFLDELMLKAKTESRKLNERLKKEEEFKKKGKKMPKPMRQPLASGSPKKGENVDN